MILTQTQTDIPQNLIFKGKNGIIFYGREDVSPSLPRFWVIVQR